MAWDAPGAGESTDPSPDFRLPDYADRLAELVAAIGLDRPHVAGLSFGGGLAIELYRAPPHPSAQPSARLRLRRLGGSLRPRETEHRLRQVLELADRPPNEFIRTVAPTLFSDQAAAETVDAFAANADEFHPAGLKAMARSFAEADLRDVLPRIDVPTLLLYGDSDVRAPLGVAKDLHAAIPD